MTPARPRRPTCPTPRLSVCLIVQNARESLGRCLASVRDIADEIVIVDGGSRDGTASLARAWATTYVRSPFAGDFAAQRNVYVELARGAWILAIDADECLGAGAAERLRRIATTSTASSYWLARHWLVPGWPPRYVRAEPLFPDPQVRLFRRRAGVRYVGRVHERLEGAGEPVRARGARLLHFDLVLRTPRSRARKVRRYETLEPGSGFPHYYLAERYGYPTRRLPAAWLPRGTAWRPLLEGPGRTAAGPGRTAATR